MSSTAVKFVTFNRVLPMNDKTRIEAFVQNGLLIAQLVTQLYNTLFFKQLNSFVLETHINHD